MPDSALPAATAPLPSRPQRTRAALLAAGLELFAERPIDAVAIDELVAAAQVAKGSFFNHFADKAAFAAAVAAAIRADIERAVNAANAGVADPLERLAGGMVVAAVYGLREPGRMQILLRGQGTAPPRDHPLNAGLRSDLAACERLGLLCPAAVRAGVEFWLGACQMLSAQIIAHGAEAAMARALLGDTLALALRGLLAGGTMAPERIEAISTGALARFDRLAAA